jgi:NADH:ubiquinone oxidoreductase subunit
LVGSDHYGNAYYELNDPDIPFYRRRYVELAYQAAEPTTVPSDWHGWLHYTNDDAPSRTNCYVYPRWGIPHRENLTGSADKYVPYSTTTRKVQPYLPPGLNLQGSFMVGIPSLVGTGLRSTLLSTDNKQVC